MEGECSADESVSSYYDPSRVPQLQSVMKLAEQGRQLALANLKMPTRTQNIGMRMLLRHAEYCEGVAQVMIALAQGKNEEAFDVWESFRHSFGKYEYELERCFDHYQSLRTIGQCIPQEVRSAKEGE